jgi:hypothetical protein
MTPAAEPHGTLKPSITDSPVSPVVLTLPADDAADEIVAQMLAILLQRRGISAAVSRGGTALTLASGAQLTAEPAVVCVVALPPVAIVRARHRVARVRTRLPAAQVVLGIWQSPYTPSELRERLGPAGDAPIASSLPEVLDLTIALLARSNAAVVTKQ